MIHRMIRLLPDEVVFGASFRHAKKIVSAYEASTDKADFIATYQQAKLNSILTIASQAPHYRNILDYKHFTDIPFTDKNIMQDQMDNFIVDKKGADFASTGGTTSGKPLRFYID